MIRRNIKICNMKEIDRFNKMCIDMIPENVVYFVLE